MHFIRNLFIYFLVMILEWRARSSLGHSKDRVSKRPSENLRRYREVLPILYKKYGGDHPLTRLFRERVAQKTGVAGDARGALRLFAELLAEFERGRPRRYPHARNP